MGPLVSGASLFWMSFTLAISIGLPIGLLVTLHLRRGINAMALFVGALTFVISQMVVRIPLLELLSGTAPYQSIAAVPLVFLLFLSLSAGLFEEVGRYLGFRYFLAESWSWRDGVAFGIGHGGIEAFLLVGLPYINNLAYSLMINAGTFLETVGDGLPGEAAEMIQDQLISLPPGIFAAAGLERMFTIALHIGLSLMVLLALVEGRPRYFVLAILLHAGVNFGAGGLASLPISIWFSEVFLGLMAAGAVWFIFAVEPRLPPGNDTFRALNS